MKYTYILGYKQFCHLPGVLIEKALLRLKVDVGYLGNNHFVRCYALKSALKQQCLFLVVEDDNCANWWFEPIEPDVIVDITKPRLKAEDCYIPLFIEFGKANFRLSGIEWVKRSYKAQFN